MNEIQMKSQISLKMNQLQTQFYEEEVILNED